LIETQSSVRWRKLLKFEAFTAARAGRGYGSGATVVQHRGQYDQPESRVISRPRPKHLDLTKIRLPLPAFVSILHRVSGAVLFLFMPLLLWLWQESLASQQRFDQFKAVASNWAVKLVLIGLLWAYLHHLCAGIRHLALDLHIGTELAAARASSWAVLVVSLSLTGVAGVMIW
jgi:succinate dehydrogenase / fumarate reductase cytochrome b subunit